MPSGKGNRAASTTHRLRLARQVDPSQGGVERRSQRMGHRNMRHPFSPISATAILRNSATVHLREKSVADERRCRQGDT